MLEVTLAGLRSCEIDHQPVMLLRQKDGERYLPIIIGPYEAQAISLGWQRVQVPRPMSHDLLRNIIAGLGAKVTHILLCDFREGIFYARIVIDMAGRHVEVDCRPSDAVALSVRLGAPIFVEDWVLDQAGLGPEGRGGQMEPAKASQEEIEKLAAFRDFINSLDLDDLEKR